MRKKYLSALLFGALLFASAGTFTSCKDYDDDIDNLQSQISANASAIEALKKVVESGDYVTGVEKSATGLTITFKNAGAKTIALEDKVGSIVTVENGVLCIDGKATEIKVAEPTEPTEHPKDQIIIENGVWSVLQEDGTYKSTGIPVSGVTVTGSKTEGYILTIFDEKGDKTSVELPSAASAITEIEVIGMTDADGNCQLLEASTDGTTSNLTYTLNCGIYYSGTTDKTYKWTDTDASQKIEGKIAKKTAIVTMQGQGVVVRVAPAYVDPSDIEFSFVDSKLGKAPITLGKAEAFKGYVVSRATSGNGLWTLKFANQEVSGVEDGAQDNLFKTGEKDLIYSITTGASQFTSTYNLKFKKTQIENPVPYINSTKLNTDSEQGNENNAKVVVSLNKENKLTFTNPTSIYASAIIIDENVKQNWGISVNGNSFTVSKYYDVQTIPAFPIYVNYFDLSTGSSYTKTIWVRVERSIADMVTLDKVNHTITADGTKDNFSASLTPMFDAMTTEQLNEWNQYINSADFKVYQVGTNADGSDKDITSGLSSVNLKFNKADGTSLTTLGIGAGTLNATNAKDARKIIVDLSQNWPGTSFGADYALDKEYYILATYKDAAGDVISQAKLPFKLSIPALSSLFVRQDGIWVNDVANAYMYDTANRAGTKKDAVYTIKNAFKQLATTVGTSTFNVALDDQDANKISGKKHSELAELSVASNETVTRSNVDNLTIKLKDDLIGGYNNADGTQLGYKKELILHVKNVKFVGMYSYGDETYDFKVKVMSPLFEGKVYAVGNAVELSATSLEEQKINDSNIKAHTYNVSEVYSIFSDKAAPDYWKRDEICSVNFESGNAELFSVSNTGTNFEDASGTPGTTGYVPAVPGYAIVRVNNNANISVNTNSTIKVTVTDTWGYKLVQEIPVVLKVNQGNN